MAKAVVRAGALPYYQDDQGNIEFLFMRPSNSKYGGDQYQIAKGRVEDGEDILEAGLREASEELGIPMRHIQKKDVKKLGVYLGRTHVFLFRLSEEHKLEEPCWETESIVRWSLDQFLLSGRDIHKPIVAEADRTIRRGLLLD